MSLSVSFLLFSHCNFNKFKTKINNKSTFSFWKKHMFLELGLGCWVENDPLAVLQVW